MTAQIINLAPRIAQRHRSQIAADLLADLRQACEALRLHRELLELTGRERRAYQGRCDL